MPYKGLKLSNKSLKLILKTEAIVRLSIYVSFVVLIKSAKVVHILAAFFRNNLVF